MSWSGLPDSLESRIIPEPNSGCWIWLGALRSSRSQYGSCWFEGKQHATHILIYKLLKGEIPKKLQQDHLCRVRCCCNPDHLEPVTAQINILRGEGLAAINARKTHCPQGHTLISDNLVNLKTGERCCRTCTNDRARARARAYRTAHREEDNAKKLAWYHANKAKKK